MEKALKAKLILEDGTVFEGSSFGHVKETVGDVVFSTAMTGYQERLTDPAMHGLILSMSYPLIGNYGINLEDMESDTVQVRGLLVREKCDKPNNFRCEMELLGFMKQCRVMGIEGIDTRALTRLIRTKGTMKGIMTTRSETLSKSQISQKFEMPSVHPVREVTRSEITRIDGAGKHLGILDLGVRKSTIDSLRSMNYKMTLFPAFTKAEDIIAENIDGLLLSSGPGSPDGLPEIMDTVRSLAGKLPLLGMGLGYLLLGLALGASVSKMKYGRHGSSYAVKNTKTGRLYFTNQCIDYAVTEVPQGFDPFLRNINDNQIEGIKNRDLSVFGVSFYPNRTQCPNNTSFFFDVLAGLLEGGKIDA